METTASIIVIASAILLAILVLVVIRVVFCKRVNRIAQYIFKELGNMEKVDDAIFFVSEYERAVKYFENEISSEQGKHTEELKKNWFFRRKKKLDEYSKKIEERRTSMDKYEIENKNTYQNCMKILDYVGRTFYVENKAEIAMKVKRLIQDASEKERLENQRLQEEQKRIRHEMEDRIRKERDEKNRLLEERIRKDKVSKAIRELDDYLPILQEHVRKKQVLDFQMLKFVEDKLDAIEDDKAFINSNDINNIERIQKKLTSVLDKFKNDESVQTDIGLIVDSFSKILK